MSRFAETLRPRVAHAMTLAAALVAGEFLRNVQVVAASPGAPHVAAAIEAFSAWFLLALTIVAIISACESSLQFGARRVLVQAAALASGTVAYAYWVGTSALLTIQYRALGMETGPALFMYIVWMGWAMSALLSGFYRAHEKARAASIALRGAELERERAQRRLIESRLQVLEAQVEPGMLFAALSRVQQLYAQDAARGDEALDELIQNLRT